MDGMLAIKVIKRDGELIVPDEPHAVINLGFKNYTSAVEELSKESGIYFLTNNHDYTWYIMDEHTMAVWATVNALYVYYAGKLESIRDLKAERKVKLESLYNRAYKKEAKER